MINSQQSAGIFLNKKSPQKFDRKNFLIKISNVQMLILKPKPY